MKQRWPIAVAGVFLQMALGAVYAWSLFGVMAVCTLLPLALSPPNGHRERVPMRAPAAAR